MRGMKSGLTYKSFTAVVAGAMLWTLCLAGSASAQRSGAVGTIDAGTTINVRTNEPIDASDSDGRVFSGEVDEDVTSRNGNIAIQRGSAVELIVKRISDREVALDLDSVTVNGRRYGIDTEENVVSSERRDGIGANERTGKYVGGGAVLGAIIGAIAGGGKGAAIGAGAGAAAGAGGQVLTKGGRIKVPAESLLTFRLSEPLRAGSVDRGFSRNGQHFHSSYSDAGTDSAAYREGLRAGRSDAERNLRANPQTSRWSNPPDRRDFEAGYNDGYQNRGAVNSGAQRQRLGSEPGNAPESVNRGSVSIGADKNISWQGPANANVYVQVDNEAPKLFAGASSGRQAAPWIEPGHVYVFVLRDANGKEIARDQRDLRSSRGRDR